MHIYVFHTYIFSHICSDVCILSSERDYDIKRKGHHSCIQLISFNFNTSSDSFNFLKFWLHLYSINGNIVNGLKLLEGVTNHEYDCVNF